MSENRQKPQCHYVDLGRRQRGVAAIEFSLLAVIFFVMVFGIIEVARAVYLFNTLQEVTRRAAAMAANSDFDKSTVDKIRRQALFANADGNLIFGYPITPEHLKIEYLSISRDSTSSALTPQPVSSMPSCPAKNYLNCLTDPYSASCIRLVRVRICEPDGAAGCTAVSYKTILPLIDLSTLKSPRATTIVPAQTLGNTFGALPCP